MVISQMVKIISLKILFSAAKHRSEKQCIYSNDELRRVYQNCKFHDPQGKDSCARKWPY